MNEERPQSIVDYIRSLGIHPKKSLGQNFLIEEKYFDAILAAGELSKEDVIIEVGPGIGVLSKEMSRQVRKLFLVEKDDAMIPILEKTFTGTSHVEIIHNDILEVDPPQNTPYKVIANIPYYITSPIIHHFLLAEHRPERLVLMTQKEVAEKIVSKKKGRTMLSCIVQSFGEAEIITLVPPKAFLPAPKVDSAIILIKLFPTPRFDVPIKEYSKVLKAGFLHKRKKLTSNLSATFRIPKEEIEALFTKLEISLESRAEHLEMEQWNLLTKEIFSYVSKEEQGR